MLKKIVVLFAILLMTFSLSACINNGIQQEETNDMIELHTWFFTSGVMNNAIQLNHTDENAVFECYVSSGNLISTDDQFAKYIIEKPNNTIYWTSFENDNMELLTSKLFVAELTTPAIPLIYVDIVLKIDDNIIGYAVIVISQNHGTEDYNAILLKSALFPKIGGVYQKVTEKHVESIIQKIKNEFKNGIGAFYSLENAYNQGLITIEDLQTIAYYQNHGIMHSGTLNTELEEAIKETRAKNLRNRSKNPIRDAKAKDVSILKYYGNYNNCLAVMISDIYHDYTNAIETITIAGVEFIYGNGNKIIIWRYN